MAKRSDDELDFLLARGRLSGPARERVLDAITEKLRASGDATGDVATDGAEATERGAAPASPGEAPSAPGGAPSSLRLLRGGRGVTVAVSVLAFAAAVAFWIRTKPATDEGGFTAKGEADASGSAALGIDVACLETGSATCHVGETILVRVEGRSPAASLAAYATREGAPDAKIWYFPEANGSWADVAAGRETQVIPRGIKLGPEHRPGRYVVHVVIARRPMGKEEALDVANADVLVRVTRPLEIVP